MKKILIIDDDQDYIDAISAILEAKGYAVSSFNDTSGGIGAVKKESPNLIILDVMMGSLDEGFQFAYKLRENEATRSIPILMSTAVSDVSGFKFDPAKDNADEDYIPVDGYIEKPVKGEQLIAKVQELIK